MSEQVQITVSGVLGDLQNGYTRCVGDTNYEEGKSIQEKYGLNKSDVARLFQHEKLKGKKTITVKKLAFTLIDDTEEVATATPEAEVPVAAVEPEATVESETSTDTDQEEETSEVVDTEEADPEWA